MVVCVISAHALPLFDFGDGTDDTSKSSSSSVPESSCWDFLFLIDVRVSAVRTGGLLSCGVLSEEDPPLRPEFLFGERVSVVRTGGLLSCGLLCTEDVPPRAGLSSSSSVSTGVATSEFVGELDGCLSFLFLSVAAELSDTERRRPPDVSVLLFCFCTELVEAERIIPKGFGEELEAFGVDACSFVCGTIESLVMDGYFVFGLALFWLVS